MTTDIFVYCFISVIGIYLTIKVYWRKKCDTCKIYMKRDINKDYAIIYKCPICKSEKQTGVTYRIDT